MAWNEKTTIVVALFLGIVIVILLFLLAFVGYPLRTSNLPPVSIVVYYVAAVVLFAFCFPLVRAYLELLSLRECGCPPSTTVTNEPPKLSLTSAVKPSRNRSKDSLLAAKGTARQVLAALIGIILGIIVFHSMVYGIDPSASELVKSVATALLGVFATVVAFYFGSRTAETAAAAGRSEATVDKALTAKTTISDIEALSQMADKVGPNTLDEMVQQAFREFQALSLPEKASFLELLDKSIDKDISKDIKNKINEKLKK